MGFDWNKAASEAGKAPDLEPGYHRVKVAKVMRFKRDGTEMKSQDGDPQVFCVVESASGAQGRISFTLNQQGGGHLAKFLLSAGADLERMTREGVEPGKFQDEEFAKKQLEGRELWVEAQRRGQYLNLYPVTEDEVPSHERQRQMAPTASDEDCPF